MGVTPSELYQDLWHQKTRVPGLSYGIVCVILHSAILVQCWLVMNGQTHNDSIYRASIASRGKNMSKFHKILCTLGVAVARFSSNDNALRYVLVILCVTAHD